MNGSVTKRAGLPGSYMVLRPTLEKANAEKAFGAEIDDGTWLRIERAFEEYGRSIDKLSSSQMSKGKNNLQSWHTRQERASKALRAATKNVDSALKKHGDFLLEASENHALENFGHSAMGENNAELLLRKAYQQMTRALAIIERAQPLEIEVPTRTESMRTLIKEIFHALEGAGLNPKVSSGWDVESISDRRFNSSDLTPFEELIVGFQIADDKKPAAFATFVRNAVHGGKQG